MAQQIKKKYLQDGSVDGTKLKLLQGQSVKGEDSLGQEVDLVKLDGTDKILLKGEEAALKSQVDAEQSRAEGQEVRIEGKIDQEVLDRQQAILDEAAARQSGDDFVQANLDGEVLARQQAILDEATARQSGDDFLQSQIDSIVSNTDPAALDSLTEIVTAFQAADSNLNDAITSLSTAATSGLNQEIADREAADLVLQGNIDAEESARISADNFLQEELNNTQIGAGLGEDGGYVPNNATNYIGSAISLADADYILDLQVKSNEYSIAQEVMDRSNADSTMQADITSLDVRVTQNETDIASNASGLSQEIMDRTNDISLVQADITSLDGRVMQNESDISTNSAAISQETMDRITDVSDLQSQINSILTNTDPTALDSLTEIVSAFQAADSNLNDAITSLSTAATSGLNQEIADREAADLVLQGNIDAEESARIAADSAIEVRVSELESVTWFKESFVYSGSDSITLTHTPVDGSTHVFIDRLAAHEGEDYSVSGSSVTFTGDLVGTGNQKLQNGDNIYVRYQYKA